MMMMMILLMMMMMCKRLAQVPMLYVPVYNMKLAMMQKNSHFYHVLSTYEEGCRQARANRGVCPHYYIILYYIFEIYLLCIIFLFNSL